MSLSPPVLKKMHSQRLCIFFNLEERMRKEPTRVRQFGHEGRIAQREQRDCWRYGEGQDDLSDKNIRRIFLHVSLAKRPKGRGQESAMNPILSSGFECFFNASAIYGAIKG